MDKEQVKACAYCGAERPCAELKVAVVFSLERGSSVQKREHFCKNTNCHQKAQREEELACT